MESTRAENKKKNDATNKKTTPHHGVDRFESSVAPLDAGKSRANEIMLFTFILETHVKKRFHDLRKGVNLTWAPNKHLNIKRISARRSFIFGFGKSIS